MNQNIFMIKHDFFDNPVSGQSYIKQLIKNNNNSEKLVLLYDPLAEEFFSHIGRGDKNLFERNVIDLYSRIEEDNESVGIKWYQLDENCTFHLSFLSQILYEIEEHIGSYLIGTLPLLNYNPNLCLFFNMSREDVEDCFLLIDGKKYLKILSEYINKFNDSIIKNDKSNKHKYQDKG